MSNMMAESATSTISGTKSPCVLVMLALAGPTLSTASVADHPIAWYESATFSATHLKAIQGLSAPMSADSKECILEIKRLSGLTWEELGKVFGVTRRSVHNWARGEAVTADHDTQIQAVLEKIRKIDRGSARSTASRLRSLNGEAPLYSLLVSLSFSALDHSGSEVSSPSNDVVVDEAALMTNWRPVTPFRGRWEDEPVEDVVPVGRYPVKRLRVATKRQG